MQTIDPFPGHYDASDPFGNLRPSGRRHTGGDWNGSNGNGSLEGDPAPAMASGVVVFAGEEPTGGNGNCVCVRMENGLYFAYLHLASIFVAEGETVTIGDHLGTVGNTGDNSVGAHLHITLSESARAYQGYGPLHDPWAFIQAYLTTLAALAIATLPKEEDTMQKFVTESEGGTTVEYVTDGIFKRRLIAGEKEILVQAGLAQLAPDKDGGVHVIGKNLIDGLIDSRQLVALLKSKG